MSTSLRHAVVSILSFTLFTSIASPVLGAESLDLSRAVLITHSEPQVAGKAIELLQNEVARRAGICFPIVQGPPPESAPVIALDVASALPRGVMPSGAAASSLTKPEGYAVWVDNAKGSTPTVRVVGHDRRGVLFGAGRLVRLLELSHGRIALAADTFAASSPKYPIRGHQLGYRDTANSYDAWDVADFEQYIRDLVLFGTNSIEIIPSLSPGEYGSKLMKRSVWEMTSLLSEMIGAYGLDVWLWLPLDEDVTAPQAAEEALEVRRALFESCAHVTDVMVPGGDPGHTPPNILMPWLDKLAGVLHSVHPSARLWVSNQGFEHDQNTWFFDYLQREQPDWLEGVVYGPWTKLSLEEQRKRIPGKFRQRRYPDITHTLRCQYPMPEWDRAFAMTLSREPICPRPHDMANIHNRFAPFADGFVSYSDGIHDDFNKIAFSMLGWDPDVSPETIAFEYAKAFLGEARPQKGAEGILMLDKNWRGPILDNEQIENTRDLWEEIAAESTAGFIKNWRLQMYLYRANYDSFLKHKEQFEQEQESMVLAAVADARKDGAIAAAQAGLDALKTAQGTPVPDVLHARMYRLTELGLLLLRSIGFQLTVRPSFYALSPERGASLDFLDRPLNDSLWLSKQFEAVLAMGDEESRRERIERILSWEDPGPGGFYDDLGNLTKQPHLVRQTTWREDPGFVNGPQEEHSKSVDNATRRPEDLRLSWLDQAQTLYGTPLKMRYDNLDPNARYMVRVTYAGRFRATMELWADGRHRIHGPLPQPDPIWPVEFDVPAEATKDGTLDLEWRLVSGRGCQVAEVWLIKK